MIKKTLRKTNKPSYSEHVKKLLRNADSYHIRFYEKNKFKGPSLYFHKKSLQSRNYKNQEEYIQHLEYIYATLVSWGMHRMGEAKTKMVNFEIFKKSIDPIIDEINKATKIDPLTITNNDWHLIGNIFNNINIMESKTKIVGNSKVMAHMIPNIVPPIDREYTLMFLENNKTIITQDKNPEWEWDMMKKIISEFFIPVAKDRKFQQKANSWIINNKVFYWDTSLFKVIDNLIIACRDDEKTKQKNTS